MKDLKPGTYKIEVKKQGYKTWAKNADVEAERDEELTVSLEPVEAPKSKASASGGKQPPSTPFSKGEYKDSTTGMEMVSVKGGCYQMGDTFGDGGSDEKPVHEVCVEDFYMGRYEVTNAQYRKFKSGHDSKSYEGNLINRSF